MKSLGSVLTCAVIALAACGGGGDDDGATPDAAPSGPNHVADPQPAAGGGVSSGDVNGELNVFVLDSRTKQPIAGASVQVVGASLTGTTGANGLKTFTDDKLAGAQTVAVSASGYVPATWYGANGAVVTVPLDPTAAPPTPELADVKGTLNLPGPTVIGHVTVALPLYSWTKNLDDPQNHIPQPSDSVCAVASAGPCTWHLRTRTGKQTHYAIIADDDTHGTLNDSSDDTFTIIGFAARTGIDLTANQTVTNEQLDMIDTLDFSVQFPASAPLGLGDIQAIPLLALGDERLVFLVPLKPPSAVTVKLPKLTGAFANGTWQLVAQAKTTGKSDPQATIFARGFDPTQTLALPAFPALPTMLAVGADLYNFEQVPGVSLHTAEIDGANGKPLWKAVVLDGTHQLKIDQTPDPLPTGTLTFKVGSATVADFDAKNFVIDEKVDSITALSSQVQSFTH